MTGSVEKSDKLTERLLSSPSWNKEPVRTTFKLSEDATKMLASLTGGRGKSVRDFFDNFCLAVRIGEELLEALEEEVHVHPLLVALEDTSRKAEFEKIPRKVRKTYVLSQTGLRRLTKLAERYKMPRDAFVEYVVRISKEKRDREAEEIQQKYSKAYELVHGAWMEAETNTYRQLKDLLGEDDPICNGFFTACTMLMNVDSAIEQALEDGTPIDPDTDVAWG